MAINSDVVQKITEIYEEGRYLDALPLLEPFHPLAQIKGTDARLIVTRMAWNLGAGRLARRLQIRAYREDPTHPAAIYYFARCKLENRGPLAAWRFLRAHRDLAGAAPDVKADWFAFHGSVLSHMRDFRRATEWFDKADAVGHDHKPSLAWLCVERSAGLLAQDRYDEALAMARRSLELWPWHRPAVQAAAHLLQLLGKDDEALAFMNAAVRHMQSGLVLMQLVQFQQELGLYAEARANLEKLPPLLPWMEKPLERWLLASQCDAAYYCGDFAGAIAFARQRAAVADRPRGKENDDYYQKFAAKLAEHDGKHDCHRVRLPVGFTRQHHMTCAPATLSTLARYWDKHHDHLTIAESICYDGTPQHADRRWAVTHGFVAREFTVTWDTAVQLIDRGVPFGFYTVDPGRAHAQAVIGYDKLRGTLLIRDPYVRNANEFIADKFIEYYRSTGPRGLVIVPEERKFLIEGVDFVDAELHDRLYEVQLAIDCYDRLAAQRAYDALQEREPDHRIALYARRSLAVYDTNVPGILAATEGLLQKFPDDANIQLSKLACLRDLAQREDRLVLLKAINAKKADPLFWHRYAQELSTDAREHSLATRLLRKCLRASPLTPGNYHTMANILWNKLARQEAYELYRLATCLGDKDEMYARTYFQASTYLKETDNALAFLRARHDRLGALSGLPAQTLFDSYESVSRSTEAFEFLEEALRQRADDGSLLLFAANAYGRYGRYDRGNELLDKAKGKCHPIAWLLGAAELADYQNKPAESLAYWRQVLERDPLSIDAHAASARILAETAGRSAAVEHLRQATARFPYHFRLHHLLVQWLQNEAPDQVEGVLRQMITINPADAWTRRELATLLAERNEHAAALEEALRGQELAPNAEATFNILGYIHLRAGRTADARQWYEQGVRQSVDNEHAIGALMRLCRSTEERRKVLAFVQEELIRQVIFGDGLLAFRTHAVATLEPQEVLDRLRDAWRARPDLWHAWSALMQQLISMRQLDEALDLARQAGERFALLPRIWMDIADVHEARGDNEACVAALEQGRVINPRWGKLARRLAGAHEHQGQFSAARDVLEQAIARGPLDGHSHGYLAYVLWLLDQKDEAMRRLQQGLMLDPSIDAAWTMLRDWCVKLKTPAVAVDLARQVAVRRPGESHAWLMLARMLPTKEEAERLAAVEKAIELSPRALDAHDLKAVILTEARRYDAAEAACSPAIFGGHPPTPLRVRAAWILGQRGKTQEAIKLMEQVLQEDQTSVWGWQRLMKWYRDGKRNDDYLKAARRYVALFPQDEAAHEYLGDALLLTKNRTEAKSSLRLAVQSNPSREYAPSTLFDVLLEDKDVPGARDMLDHLRRFKLGAADVLWREIKLASAADDLSMAVERMRRLAVCPTVEPWMFRRALESMHRGADWTREGRDALRRALVLPEINTHAAAALIEDYGKTLTAQEWKECRAVVDQLSSRPECWRAAAMAFVTKAGDTKALSVLRKFAKECEAGLRADEGLWGNVGWAFSVCNAHAQVIAWHQDWKTRADVRAWELLNLASSLRELGRRRAAHEVDARAVALPRDNTYGAHQLFLAADDLAYSRSITPERRKAWGSEFTMLDPAAERVYYRFLYYLLKPLTFEQAAPLKEIKTYMLSARSSFPAFLKNRLLRSIYRRAMLRLMRRSRSPGVWLYCAGCILASIHQQPVQRKR